MDRATALRHLIPPGHRRPGKLGGLGGVVQILVTSLCNRSCYSCTQASNAKRDRTYPDFMPPEMFEQAVLSLKGYFAVTALFGGNPAVSPYFKDYCEIMRRHVRRDRAGIWCNDPIKVENAVEMSKTFSASLSNLNCHLDPEAYRKFKEGWPSSNPFGHDRDSRHSPPWVALKDVVPDEGERWDLISKCEINLHWSSAIGMFRGELRGFFCEVALAAALLHQHEPDYPDTGIDPTRTYDGRQWWQLPMTSFAQQVDVACHSCGIPLRGRGQLAIGGEYEEVSKTHEAVYRPKDSRRPLHVITSREELGGRTDRVTNYLLPKGG
jgi:hypothetical protein